MDNLLKMKPKQGTQGIDSPVRRRLLTVQEAAVYLGRGVDSTRQLIYKRELKVIQEGQGKVWIAVDELDNWIQRKAHFA